MTFWNKLATAVMLATLGFSTLAMAADGKGLEGRKFDLIGPIVSMEVESRQVTVKDTITGNLYSFYVVKDFKMPSLNTMQRYLNFEQLQPGILVNLRVQVIDIETAKVRIIER